MVNCLLTPDSKVQTLYLQYVKGKSANEYIPITDAKVYVSTSFFTATKTIYFHYVNGNRWESENYPIEGGRHYRLTVEIPGREPLQAETTCPVAYQLAYRTDLHEVHSMDYHSVYYQIEQFPTDKSHIKTSPVWVFAKGIHKTLESFRRPLHDGYMAGVFQHASDDARIAASRPICTHRTFGHQPFPYAGRSY